ncbi:hypothetical protein RIF29_30155 [Crotalaria pallida]|uniref:RRM domain-containing protein n=1 Tax=Crotalaria pallida TaxID=3830 RepID=A0AAN9EMN5_CROPI
MRERERELGREWTWVSHSQRALKETRWAGNDRFKDRVLAQDGKDRFYVKDHLRGSTSFFFSNFPVDVGFVDLWKAFQRWGRVVDVFISQRRDKKGERFGFVRFSDVKDCDALAKKLDSICLGSFKLKVNVPRFDKVNASMERVRMKKEDVVPPLAEEEWPRLRRKDVLSSTSPMHIKEQKGVVKGKDVWKVKSNNCTDGVMEMMVDENHLSWLKKCFIGELLGLEEADGIHSKIFEAGFSNMNVMKMGGKFMLLGPKDGCEITTYLKEDAKWFSGYFSNIQPWSSKVKVRERLCWLRCYGVPVVAWSEQCFKTIAERVGKYVGLDTETQSCSRFDMGRILISTEKKAFITADLHVKIHGTLHEVHVMEEVYCYCDNASCSIDEGTVVGSEFYPSSDSEDRWQESQSGGAVLDDDVAVMENRDFFSGSAKPESVFAQNDAEVLGGGQVRDFKWDEGDTLMKGDVGKLINDDSKETLQIAFDCKNVTKNGVTLEDDSVLGADADGTEGINAVPLMVLGGDDEEEVVVEKLRKISLN